MIIKAIDVLDQDKSIVKGEKKGKEVEKQIESKYGSYVASFGGSIINTGILGTVMIFEANDEKKRILKLLIKIYQALRGNYPNIDEINPYRSLKQFDPEQRKLARNGLVSAGVALKLAMRVYKMVDNENKAIND